MPSYYEAVDEEPTYELAEGIIKAFIRDLKKDSDYIYNFPNASGYYIKYPRESLEYRRLSRFDKRKDLSSAIHLIIKHFPDVLIQSDNSIYIKDSTKHLLVANDLLIVDYYLLLLKQYEERVSNYQRYLDKQQYKQQAKFLFVVLFPFILFMLMIFVGD